MTCMATLTNKCKDNQLIITLDGHFEFLQSHRIFDILNKNDNNLNYTDMFSNINKFDDVFGESFIMNKIDIEINDLFQLSNEFDINISSSHICIRSS